VSGRVEARDLGKKYKRYRGPWRRLAEWATGGLVFVHRSVLTKNGGLPAEKVLGVLERELGAKAVVIDGPPHHVGMFATPLHDGRVLAGPPDVSRALRDGGFETAELPWATTPRDRAYITYNNVVVSGRRVFMPAFGLDSDAAAAAIWRAQGFEVIPIPCAPLYLSGGTIHCLVNVLARNI